MELENINSDIMNRVISEMNNYDYNSFTDEDIREALNKDYLSVRDFQALLSPKAINYLEEWQRRLKNVEKDILEILSISLPLYIFQIIVIITVFIVVLIHIIR